MFYEPASDFYGGNLTTQESIRGGMAEKDKQIKSLRNWWRAIKILSASSR
jgi:hypothetical protein